VIHGFPEEVRSDELESSFNCMGSEVGGNSNTSLLLPAGWQKAGKKLAKREIPQI